MFDAHANAVFALLAADPLLTVYDGKVPNTIDPKVNPYVVAYFAGSFPDLQFRGIAHTFQLRITLHCVGGSSKAARVIADRVRAVLMDVTPVVSGRVCYPLRYEEDTSPPLTNEVTGSQVVDQIEPYVLRSVPAA